MSKQKLKEEIEFLEEIDKHSCCDKETKYFKPCKRCRMVRERLAKLLKEIK